jgi:hypothetical protein
VTDELNMTEEKVWNEHLDEVHATGQAVYLGVVLIGGFLLMVALIALLGATSG